MKCAKLYWLVLSMVCLLILVQTGYGMDNVCQYYAQWSKGIPSDTGFFPIGMSGNAVNTAGAMAKAGINVFLGSGDAATLVWMKSNKIKLLCPQDSFTLSTSTQTNYGATIAGWDQMDEPDNAQGNGACLPPDSIQQLYTTWRTNDSTRPVCMNLGQGVSNFGWTGRGSCDGNLTLYPQYILGCDVVSFDIYPVSHESGAINGALWYLAKGVDSLRVWCNDQKPVWDWIECTQVGTDGPCPTTKQVRGLVWESLVHGAKGIQYFAPKLPGATGADYNGVLNDTAMLANITRINQRIKSLAPVLNSADIKTGVTVGLSDPTVPVDILVKQHGGGLYIFAAAMRSGTTTATFTVSNPPQTTATVLDESRTLTLSGGQFSDTFTGYDVHLYQIGGVVSAIADQPAPGQSAYHLLAISPNPFISTTAIVVQNTSWLPPTMAVYSLDGARLRTLALHNNMTTWDGRDENGRRVGEGVYLIKIQTVNGVEVRPVMMVK